MAQARGKSAGLWQYGGPSVDDDPFRAPRFFEGTWRDAVADVIEHMAARGCPPGSYDDAELWEVAAALGANNADRDDAELDPSMFRAPG